MWYIVNMELLGNSVNMKHKYTHFHEEIDGRYHYQDEPLGFGFWFAVVVGILSVLVLLAEWTGMTDNFIRLWM